MKLADIKKAGRILLERASLNETAIMGLGIAFSETSLAILSYLGPDDGSASIIDTLTTTIGVGSFVGGVAATCYTAAQVLNNNWRHYGPN